MKLTLYGDAGDVRVCEILSLGKICEIDIKLKQTKEGEKIICNDDSNFDNCLTKCWYPVLKSDANHIIGGCTSIMRFIAYQNPQYDLLGGCFANKIRVDSIICMYYDKLECIYYNNIIKNDNSKDVENQLKELCSSLNQYLLKNTYLAAENITIVDVAISVLLFAISKIYLQIALSQNYPNLNRLVVTILNQKGVSKICENIASGSPAKSTGGSVDQPKKIDEEALGVQELNNLSASTFVGDEWKREYSNTKDIFATMKTFWSKIDTQGWCFYSFKYNKLPNECKLLFLTSNLLTGFIQRMHNLLRKNAFGVWYIVGEEGNFDVKGVMMFRGTEMPRLMTLHPSVEFYEPTKLNINNSADKKLIDEYFVGGRDTNCKTIGGRQVAEVIVYK